MNFAKFVSMLDTKGLFLCRARQLTEDDPFEGGLGRANQRWRERFIKELGAPRDQCNETFNLFRDIAGRQTAVCCWHMSDHESMAMWKLYAGSAESVAIQTTYEALAETVDRDPHTYVGVVRYIDYDRTHIDELQLLHAWMHKRKSFEHEREVRIIGHMPDWREDDDSPGTVLPVDLASLIHAVYVAPMSPVWFGELIAHVASRFDLNVPIHTSSLEDRPIF